MREERGDYNNTCYSCGCGRTAVDGAGETDGDRGKRRQRWRDDKDLQGDGRMILSDRAIMALLQEGTLSISPLKEQQIQPASVDIRLGDTFSIVEDSSAPILTLSQEMAYKEIHAEKYLLMPGQFVLATTMEYIRLPDDLTAFVEGRSSLGRMGLFIQNAGWVDPGFSGEITLELFNANRCAIELRAGRRIGQLVFAQMDQAALHPYRGKYQGQRGATGSKVYLDNESETYFP